MLNGCIRRRALGLASAPIAVLAVLLVCVESAEAGISLYPVPNAAAPISLVAAGDGNLWFTTTHTGEGYSGAAAGEIGEITPSGTVSLRPFAFPFSSPRFWGVGPDGRPLLSDGNTQGSSNLFSFDPATVTYNQLTTSSEYGDITGATADHGGAIWYDQEYQVSRVSHEGPSYPVPFGQIQPFYYQGLQGLTVS